MGSGAGDGEVGFGDGEVVHQSEMGFGGPGGEMGHAVWVGLVVGFAGFLVAGWEEVGVDVDFGRHGLGLLFFFFGFLDA